MSFRNLALLPFALLLIGIAGPPEHTTLMTPKDESITGILLPAGPGVPPFEAGDIFTGSFIRGPGAITEAWGDWFEPEETGQVFFPFPVGSNPQGRQDDFCVHMAGHEHEAGHKHKAGAEIDLESEIELEVEFGGMADATVDILTRGDVVETCDGIVTVICARKVRILIVIEDGELKTKKIFQPTTFKFSEFSEEDGEFKVKAKDEDFQTPVCEYSRTVHYAAVSTTLARWKVDTSGVKGNFDVLMDIAQKVDPDVE